jgi:tetratricopeptide (TPR) repeat protein
VPDFAPKQVYSRAEVRRLLCLRERRLQSWEQQGLVPRLSIYTFSDIVVLRTLTRLREDGVRAAKIRRAVAALREQLDAGADPLKEFKIFSDGERMVAQMGASKMEPISGQLLLDFDPAELHKMLSFPSQSSAQAARSVEESRRLEAAGWFEKALELERTGAPVEDVIQAYERSAMLDPASAGTFVNLGTIHFHLRDWDAAERHYRRALDADPRYALAQFNLGNLFDEKGDRALALVHYMVALRLDANYADAHYNVALLYQSSGQLMRAVRHWKAYLKLDPSSAWAAIARQELDRLRHATLIQGSKRAGEQASSTQAAEKVR